MIDSKKQVEVEVHVLEHGRGLPLPSYASAGAAGLDLCAAIGEEERLLITPGQRVLVPTGIELALPRTLEAQVRPRSGLASRYGITVLNAPGTVDSDYRGEVQVVLINMGSAPFPIHRGDRIAQLVVAPVTQISLKAVDTLSETERGKGGFGSTGIAQQ